MPCTGQTLTSPSITCLDYLVSWDISGAQPVVTITNNSTVSSYAALSWWFYITTPSGVSIHGVDLSSLSSYPTPDIAGITWTTRTFNLPTPFGNPPCGQVEWSPNTPYSVEVFVVDSATSTPHPLNSYTKTAIIVRPGGNTQNTCGNFGVAQVSVQVDCQNKNIMCLDSTILTYNNILATAPDSNTWTLVYPQAPSGDIPNRTATNTPSVNFPVSVNSDGYTLYLQEYVTYNYGNGVTVKVQYKLFSSDGSLGVTFAVACNTNLCLLQCQMKAFYDLSKTSCGTVEDANLQNTMTRLNFLFAQVLTGIFQPLCGIDVGGLIAEMKRIGKFSDNCGCGCGDSSSNFGFSNPTGGSTSACCPVYVNVLDKTTGLAPTECPNSYFPATVFDPTNTTIIGVATSMPDEINIINSNAAWQAYGTAFDTGNCKVGFFPLNSGTIIPNINVIPADPGTTTCTPAGTQTYSITVGNTCGTAVITAASYPYVASVNFGSGAVSLGSVSSDAALIAALNTTSTKPAAVTFALGSTSGVLNIVVNNTNCAAFNTPIVVTGCVKLASTVTLAIFDRNTTHAPTACPLSFYPTVVWSIDNTLPLAVASSADDLVSILNSNAGWTAIGTFSNAGNCFVTVNLTTTISPSLFVPVSVPTGGGSGCVSNTQVYQIPVLDYCLNTPISTLSYPFFAYVDYGNGSNQHALGSVSSLTQLITLLNANSNKPGPITFSAGSGGSSAQIAMNVLNTNCTTYSTPTIVYGEVWTKDFIAIGGNHHNLQTNGGSGTLYRASTNTLLGKTCTYPVTTERPFHSIHVNKNGCTYITEPTTGKIYVYYTGDPLNPALVAVIQLSTIVSGGSGNFTGNPHTYGEASYYGLYFATDYIDPTTTDTLYVVESITGTIWSVNSNTNTVITGFQNNKLLGKCPRQVLTTAQRPQIYFTQDGHIEQDASLSSGIAVGSVIVLDTNSFSGAGINTVVIDSRGGSAENIVASSFNAVDTIIYTGDKGSIFTYNKNTPALTGTYIGRWIGPGSGVWTRWTNTAIISGTLFAASYGAAGLGGTYYLAISDIPLSSPNGHEFENMDGVGLNVYTHYNFIGLPGTCYGLLTFYNGSGSPAGVAKFKLDGTFLEVAPLPIGDIYNFVLLSIAASTPSTPNSLCALP